MNQPAYTLVVWLLAMLLFIEAGALFFIVCYYKKKLKDEQERFAGYLKYLDDQNYRLKRKIATLSRKKLRPQKGKEFTL